CQFFALTAMFLPWQLGAPASRQAPGFRLLLFNLGQSPALAEASDAAALGRADAVVRDRRHVADRSDLEADRLKRPKRAFAARTGALHFDFQRADAMFGGLLAGILGGDLRGVRSRLAAALEPHHAGAGPGNRIALRIGDGDHRVVE